MVDILCDTLTPRLINTRDRRTHRPGRTRGPDRPPASGGGLRITRKVLAEYQPTLESSALAGQDFLIERVQRSAPDAAVLMFDGIVDRVDEVFDLKTMATNEFLNDPTTLESMFKEVGHRGVRIHQAQRLCLRLLHRPRAGRRLGADPQPWVMPLFGLFTGWFTDWAALRLIFYPREPKKYLGFIKWQGLFQQHRIVVAQDYGSLIGTKVLTPDRLIRSLCTESGHRAGRAGARRGTQATLREELGDLNRYVDIQLRISRCSRRSISAAFRSRGYPPAGCSTGSWTSSAARPGASPAWVWI